jgi:hypothetical protein
MAWTPPATWSVGELLTAAKMNTHVRDNFNALYFTNWTQALSAGNGQTSVGAWTQLAGAAMTTIGRRVLMLCSGSFWRTIALSNADTGLLQFGLDGVNVGIAHHVSAHGNSIGQIGSLCCVVTPSAAPHTFQILWHRNTAANLNHNGYQLLAIENV